MGRTLPSVTMQLREEEQSYQPFRRALRKSDQEIFDELFVAAKNHRSAVAMAANTLPMESILLSMLIEQRKEIKHLQVRLEAFEERLNHR